MANRSVLNYIREMFGKYDREIEKVGETITFVSLFLLTATETKSKESIVGLIEMALGELGPSTVLKICDWLR